MYEDRKYAIVSTTEFLTAVSAGEILPEYLFPNILETSFETLRYSIDKTQFVIKTDNEQSAEYLRSKAIELNIPYMEYDNTGTLELMATSAWNIIVSPFTS